MAKIADILQIERNRENTEQQRQIHFFADGKFFRAYEWSAWLCCAYISSFKVTKRHVQSVDAPMVFVGFPQTSMEKFTPQDCSTQQVENGHIVLTLPQTMIRGAESMAADFAQWKESIPIAEAKHNPQPLLAEHPVSLTGIMKKVLEYNVLEHSPIESMQFITNLQRQLTEVL